MLKVFILKSKANLPNDKNPWYKNYSDTLDAVVVVAKNEDSARLLANEESMGESDKAKGTENVWLNKDYTTCEEINLNSDKEEILLTDCTYWS